MVIDEPQLVLDMSPQARQRDPSTSHVAAASMRQGAAEHRAKILAALRAGGPMTYVEIGTATYLEPVKVARRMAELLRARSVRRLEQTRPTPSKREAHLWEAT